MSIPDYDVIVAGAGPAGSCAAREAALTGARVLLIERRRQIGVPAQCAGFLPLAATRELAGVSLAAALPVKNMSLFLPDGSTAVTPSPGIIINRERLDQLLAAQAEGAGVQVMTGTWALDISPAAPYSTITMITPEGPQELTAEIVIGADGPRSRIGEQLGICNEVYIAAAQWTVPLLGSVGETRVYFDRRIPGGYGWLFPAPAEPAPVRPGTSGSGRSKCKAPGRLARVGVGVERGAGVSLQSALKWLLLRLADEGLIEPRSLTVTGGLIPAGGPLVPGRGNILLAGDAAGLCHPVSGAGIAAAMASGRLAGKAAAGTLGGSVAQAFTDYEEEIQELFGRSFRAASLRRNEMRDRQIEDNDSPEAFATAVRQAWLTSAPVSTEA